ncbi:MAG: asparagine synthase (glutamine-hydrolyzing) [Elusimicrobia bacterium GWA2_61_42]|nr:MAG: asparagine synthase (glutamine-hydrolyzing) [Elusimicrobia bacterium GWA2_61_42]OGR79837.1 MAG: asparagine synthase (glutamine-hydrolyzing) [Elusimicrobia bacterium GWC2_61_25]
MCGICGIYNYGSGLPVTREALKAMNDLIVHRGPDDEGYYAAENAGLAMRRLSIIDVSTGHQPISNEDGTLWIVFNGEIYNFQELREGLLARGHKFKTKSDTEVILHLYEEKGADFPRELRGMFAVAIWDKNRKRLVLARDRMGKKPLYYAVTPSFFAFASELRSLLTVPGMPRDIDLKAVDSYLTLQYIPSPMSVFKSARKLEPASTLVFENGHLTTEKYWDLPLGARKLTGTPVEELKERLRAELAEAVKIRLISEVPLGAFLSGGIDSSVVVALMAKASPEPVKTFSIGFKEAEFSELGYAKQVARMYGTQHTEFVVEANMASVLEKLAWHYGEPFADSSALPSYFVAKETRKAVTVALNGDGGDENFGGYIRYQAMKGASYFSALPMWAKKAALAAMEPFPEKTAPFNTVWRLRKFLQATSQRDLGMTYLSTMSFFKTDEKERLLSDAFKNGLGRDINFPERYIGGLFNKAEGLALTEKLMYTDLHSYLPDCLMTKMDIAAMANSLEARSPFLDHKVMEFAFLLPDNMKLRGFTGTKWLLKEAFKDMLPPQIYKRGKMGFGIPVGAWFRGELKDYWAGACLSQKALGRGYFKPEALYKLWDEHQRGTRDNGYRLWALLMLELWHRQYAPDFRL